MGLTVMPALMAEITSALLPYGGNDFCYGGN